MDYKSYPVTFRLKIPSAEEVRRIADELGYTDSKVYSEFIEGMIELARGKRTVPKIIKAIWVLRKNHATMRDTPEEELRDAQLIAAEHPSHYYAKKGHGPAPEGHHEKPKKSKKE